jgi:hypothetical protein
MYFPAFGRNLRNLSAYYSPHGNDLNSNLLVAAEGATYGDKKVLQLFTSVPAHQ